MQTIRGRDQRVRPSGSRKRIGSDPRVIIFCFIGRTNTRRIITIKERKNTKRRAFRASERKERKKEREGKIGRNLQILQGVETTRGGKKKIDELFHLVADVRINN